MHDFVHSQAYKSSAQSHEQKTSLVGQIARALSVFCIDEIIIFSDGQTHDDSKRQRKRKKRPDDYASLVRNDYTGNSDPDQFFVHLLSYLETPPYLRKELFPLHQNLRSAGTLPSLDLPHHLKAHEWCQYREGITVLGPNESNTYVEAGLRIPVTIKKKLPPKTRVTLSFMPGAKEANASCACEKILADAVHPNEPRESGGYYWGFQVRKAESLSEVFTECKFDDGYDITIGTSERGVSLESLYSENSLQIESFMHMLVVFGGVGGLEVAIENDEELQRLGVVEVKEVFDRWVNICTGQGSRTIRTEEALWIGLTGLKKIINQNHL